MTLAELLEVVYQYHPRGIDCSALGYRDTLEFQRQRAVKPRAVAGYPMWKALLGRLRLRYPVGNDAARILDRTWLNGSHCYDPDPAYAGDITIPGYRIGFYVIRLIGAAGEEPAVRDLAREIEAAFPGYELIPPELGEEVVPEVSTSERWFGEATIYACLLSEAWARASEPWPPVLAPPISEAEMAKREADRLEASERAAREFRPRPGVEYVISVHHAPDDEPREGETPGDTAPERGEPRRR
jgi:hypothetical protein